MPFGDDLHIKHLAQAGYLGPKAAAEARNPSRDYPKNVCVHGNGFVQIVLSGDPHETRLHIWHPALTARTQTVNTKTHNHRFGFHSAVLRGSVLQTRLDVQPSNGPWTKWVAGPDRLPTGNRALVKQPGKFTVTIPLIYPVSVLCTYKMSPGDFHRTTPITDIAVTLMTKTKIIPATVFQASVLCRDGLEPDQEYDRSSILLPTWKIS